MKDQAAWQSVTGYVQRLEAAKAHPAPATRSGAADPGVPTAPTSTAAGQTTSDVDSKLTNPRDVKAEGPSKTASLAPPADSFSARDLMTWRPLAAMLFTGLSLPLAYWTRTSIPEAIARARASLPGPGPRPRSLRDESGA